MFVTPIHIPFEYESQIIAFEAGFSCFLFAQPYFQPSYWLLLKREGFSGDLMQDSLELRLFFTTIFSTPTATNLHLLSPLPARRNDIR